MTRFSVFFDFFRQFVDKRKKQQKKRNPYKIKGFRHFFNRERGGTRTLDNLIKSQCTFSVIPRLFGLK